MNLNTLARKAAKDALEVEDMIRFVLIHGAVATHEIERLQAQYQWPMEGLLPDGSRVVPLGRWVQVCAAYGMRGVVGVAPFLDDLQTAPFAVSLLGEVYTFESLNALLMYCEDASFNATHFDDANWCEWEALIALNGLLGLDDCVQTSDAVRQRLLKVLQRAYTKAVTPNQQLTVLCASRGAYSDACLTWLKNLTLAEVDACRYQKQFIKIIQKRLSSDFKPLTPEVKRQLRRQRATDV